MHAYRRTCCLGFFVASLTCATVHGQQLEDDFSTSLLEARKGFQTVLTKKRRESRPLDDPPSDLFSIVQYETPIGNMSAYLSKPIDPSKKYPAIIWLTGEGSVEAAP